MPSNYAFATLVTSDSYLPGALALSHSLRLSGTPYPIVALCPPSTLSSHTITHLYRAFDKVVYVPLIKSGEVEGDRENLRLLGRPELDVTFTKLHVFNPDVMTSTGLDITSDAGIAAQTHYERIAFLDADTFVLKKIDDIFDYLDDGDDVVFAAAADVGWPDIFNSGVFVARPGTVLFEELVKEAERSGSFDGE
jgi:hypothetical protein